MATAVHAAAGELAHAPAEERSSGSFLVRIWYEAREVSGGAPTFRGYIKNLQTGEERFVRDPATMGEQILRQLGDEAPAGAGDLEGDAR